LHRPDAHDGLPDPGFGAGAVIDGEDRGAVGEHAWFADVAMKRPGVGRVAGPGGEEGGGVRAETFAAEGGQGCAVAAGGEGSGLVIKR